jgi:hypothetical protein
VPTSQIILNAAGVGFTNGSWYALTDDEVAENFQHSEGEVDFYIKGIMTAGIQIWKYEAPEALMCLIILICLVHTYMSIYICLTYDNSFKARNLFQNEVLAPLVETRLF